MPRKVLDTSVLVAHRRKRPAGRRIDQLTASETKSWGDELALAQDAAFIVTPVYIEFIAGVGSTAELKLAREFLQAFTILDDGQMTDVDCRDAIRIAQRVPRSGAPRHLGDCLIRAIANRYRADVFTLDRVFPK